MVVPSCQCPAGRGLRGWRWVGLRAWALGYPGEVFLPLPTCWGALAQPRECGGGAIAGLQPHPLWPAERQAAEAADVLTPGACN